MMDKDDYFLGFEGDQKQVFYLLDDLLCHQSGLICQIRYRIPFYFKKSWVCYLNAVKHKGVELAFLRGNEMSNTGNYLDFNGRKQVAGITFYLPAEINELILLPLLQEAILLDEKIPYAAKRKK